MPAMQDIDHTRPATPPHHPTAGVKITREEIETIVRCAFPELQLGSLTQIESGKSYNNRIYFLTLKHQDPSLAEHEQEQHKHKLILKVIGRFWGASKIRNEVACLHLLNEHCPGVPVPEAVAWSEDGLTATIATTSKTGTKSLFPLWPSEESDDIAHGGWILMTELPGIPFSSQDLDDTALAGVARQLGDMVASWRKNIPAQTECGNVSLDSSNGLQIKDSLQDGIVFNESVRTASQLHKAKLTQKLKELSTVETFAPNRSLLDPLKQFIAQTLPTLRLSPTGNSSLDKFIFTHYDLSPRNVLTQGQPPRITGIVDFEFAGFFPAVDEFLNDYVNNQGDWPSDFYRVYLEQLERNGVATPQNGFDKDAWNKNLWLDTLASRIAPWWLPGDSDENEIKAQLEEARSEVQNMLQKLSGEAQ